MRFDDSVPCLVNPKIHMYFEETSPVAKPPPPGGKKKKKTRLVPQFMFFFGGRHGPLK